MGIEFLEHRADVKFKVTENSLESLFVSCGSALNKVVYGDLRVEEKEKKIVGVEGNDLVSLIHNFLEEFLFLLDSENFLVSRVLSIDIDEENFSLKAELVGDLAENYLFTNDVKAVTYSELKVEKIEECFEAIVVLDV